MTTRRRTTSAPPWRTPLIIAVVMLLAIGAGVLLALATTRSDETASPATPTASGSEPTSPSPSVTESPIASPGETAAPAATAPATPSASPKATPVVRAPEDLLPPYTMARVVVDGLRIRAEPSTEAESLATLASGDLLGVMWVIWAGGPVDGEGYRWYPVQRLEDSVPEVGSGSWLELIPEGAVSGWVAAEGPDGDFIEAVAPRCVEGDPDLAVLDSWTPWEGLACLGDRSITFEGVFGCAGCGGFGPGTFEPEWLAHPLNFNLVSVEPNDRMGPTHLHFPPGGPEVPEAASVIRVTAHHDDPAAEGCVLAPAQPPDEPEPIDPELAALYCRMQLVVETYEVIGTDEDFPSG